MPANALQSTRAYKEMVLTVVVTPSPAPVAMLGRHVKRDTRLAALTADPYAGPQRLASATSATWDTPVFGRSQVVAQATPQGNIPVTFNAKPDPNGAYLKVIPHTSLVYAAYGANTYTCPYEIFGSYTTLWKVIDWGYGTTTAAQAGTFPVMNYPVTSYLSWAMPDIGKTAFQAFSNSGSPGQLTFQGSANVSQQHCVNLSLTVPASQPAGAGPAQEVSQS